MKARKTVYYNLRIFFSQKIWDIDISKFPLYKRVFYNLMRMFSYVFSKYREDKCTIKASALTYYTLMSMVPLLALVLGIARGFGLANILEQELKNNVISIGSSTEKIFEFARNMIEHAKGGLFTGLGLIILFWAVIRGLGKIEMSFNTIWNIRRKRSFARQFSDYLSVMMLLPVCLIGLSGLNVFLGAGMKGLEAEYSIMETISPVFLSVLKTLPYIIVWILFVFLYIFIPNTKVQFKSALISGIIVGTLFQLIQWMYITFQVEVSSYNAIYGSFAAIPLLLIWLQLSWSLVLMGCEMCYYLQNIESINGLISSEENSVTANRLLFLIILHRIVSLFKENKELESSRELSRELNLKFADTLRGITLLLNTNLIVEVQRDDRIVYMPAFDINMITVAFAINQFEMYGKNPEYKISGLSNNFSIKFNDNYYDEIRLKMKDVLVVDLDKLNF